MPFTLAKHAGDAQRCTRATIGAPRGVRTGASARGGVAEVGRRSLLTALGAALLLLLAFASWQDAQAQPAGQDRREATGATPASADTRWAPWLGCWELVDDRLDGDSPAAYGEDGVGRPSPGARVCIAPSGSGAGAVRRTIVDGRTVVEESVAADGKARSFGVPACTGTERAEWSASGLRLLTTAEMGCEGQARWRATGISLIAHGPRWIDVQLIEEAGRRSVRVRRYRPASRETAAGGAAPSAAGDDPGGRRAAPAPLDLREIAELTARVPIEVLQAVLLETRPTFALDASRLVELRRANVSPAVIDLMVALSFPEQFAVDRVSSGGASPGPVVGWYDPYGWILPYSAFVSPMWAGGGGEWYVIDGGGAAGPSEEPRGRGRVVDGRGYTRVRPLGSGVARRSGESGGGGGTGSTASTSSDSSSSGSSGGVSSSGYSSGGSGDGARTAVPR